MPARVHLMVRSLVVLAVACLISSLTSPVPVEAQGRTRGFGRVAIAATAADRVDQEPAYARGYADGFRCAQDDRQNNRKYDPVGHREYRDGDQGFSESYGSRDAYKDNYRAGFRAGYDAGYRESNGGRR